MLRSVYNYFYNLLPVKERKTDRTFHLLSDDEVKQIKKRERVAIAIAATLGALGVIFLYLPYYFFPEFFPNTNIQLWGNSFDLPIIFFIYVGILVAIELFLLTLLNIWCAHEVAVLTGYIKPHTKHEPDLKRTLVDISLDKKDKSSLNFGINPYEGLSKSAILLRSALIIMKASLSNLIFRFIIQRVLGRYAIQALQDFAGIPIFALWNAYGTKRILRESRVIIMGDNIVTDLVQRIKMDQEITPDFKYLMYQTLCYVAISKRDFHHNHYLLAKQLFDRYDLEPIDETLRKKQFLSLLAKASPSQQEICRLIIAVGFILDGQLSAREQLRITQMKKDGIFDFSIKEMKQFNKDFVEGKGIETVLKKYI